jgi:hypothetical protein
LKAEKKEQRVDTNLKAEGRKKRVDRRVQQAKNREHRAGSKSRKQIGESRKHSESS